MPGRKKIPSKIKALILDYGVQYKATYTCESIINHVEDILNTPPKVKKEVDRKVKA